MISARAVNVITYALNMYIDWYCQLDKACSTKAHEQRSMTSVADYGITVHMRLQSTSRLRVKFSAHSQTECA